jgi:hypothetical protein
MVLDGFLVLPLLGICGLSLGYDVDTWLQQQLRLQVTCGAKCCPWGRVLWASDMCAMGRGVSFWLYVDFSCTAEPCLCVTSLMEACHARCYAEALRTMLWLCRMYGYGTCNGALGETFAFGVQFQSSRARCFVR